MKLVIDGQTVEVPGGSSSSDEIYSTQETCIGTWIDGKPLYRMVGTGVAPSNDTKVSTIIDLSSHDPDVITSIRGVLFNPPNTTFNIPHTNGVDCVYGVYLQSIKAVSVGANNSGFYGKNVVLIVEYTKTTDTATI